MVGAVVEAARHGIVQGAEGVAAGQHQLHIDLFAAARNIGLD